MDVKAGLGRKKNAVTDEVFAHEAKELQPKIKNFEPCVGVRQSQRLLRISQLCSRPDDFCFRG